MKYSELKTIIESLTNKDSIRGRQMKPDAYDDIYEVWELACFLKNPISSETLFCRMLEKSV